MITIEEQGATTLITTAPRANREPRIRIMSKDEYLHIESGEILPLNHAAKNRQDNLKSLRRTMRELRAIINTNTETNAELKEKIAELEKAAASKAPAAKK